MKNTSLPEKWVIKCKRSPEYQCVVDFINEYGDNGFYGLNNYYCHFPKTIEGYITSQQKEKGYKEITLEQFKKHTMQNKDNKFPFKVFKLFREDAERIISAACHAWATKLANTWGAKLLLEGYVVIEEDFYLEMRRACTVEQHKLFDEIFGSDKKKVKKSMDVWLNIYRNDDAGFRTGTGHPTLHAAMESHMRAGRLGVFVTTVKTTLEFEVEE